MYCKLLTNGKQLPAFPLKAITGIEPRPQRWEVRVLPLCHCGPALQPIQRKIERGKKSSIILSFSVYFLTDIGSVYKYLTPFWKIPTIFQGIEWINRNVLPAPLSSVKCSHICNYCQVWVHYVCVFAMLFLTCFTKYYSIKCIWSSVHLLWHLVYLAISSCLLHLHVPQ